jgi:predicted homoserine dehydrogenase-like protein
MRSNNNIWPAPVEIKVSVAGSLETDTGQKTSTILEQLQTIPGITLYSFFSRSISEAQKVISSAGLSGRFIDIKKTRTVKTLPRKRFFTDDLDIFLAESPANVVLISEIDTSLAVEIIYKCIMDKKNIVNLNAVSEATLGVVFKQLARENDIIYSVGAGDEPAAALELVDYCIKLGLDIIAAGKGKNNPLDIYSIPDDFADIQGKTGVSSRSIASFVDGTKTMLEMAILSNAAGIKTDRQGMHGPAADVSKLSAVFCPKKDGGILDTAPAVDYAVGDVAPGVFTVFTSSKKSILDELKYLKMDGGPYYVLYKPYHLGNIEAPLSIYDIAVLKKPTLTVKDGFVTMTAGRAKKHLGKGQRLDGPGGYTYSGITVDYGVFKKSHYVPIGLLENSTLISDIEKDGMITFDRISLQVNSLVSRLWETQQKFTGSVRR